VVILVNTSAVAVSKRAPDFDLLCTQGLESTRRRVTLADYRDHWLILVFYPRDFSLVCPTELTALSARIEEFHRRGCDVLGVSTDSIESHERWIVTPRAQGGLGELFFPLASDPDGVVSRSYGVYLEQQHVALRGLFIIDPNGVLQYQGVHNLSVGRRSEDVLRVLAALETGGMCPEDWCPDCPPLDPTQALTAGRMISHYRIEEEVGKGAFASVFRARDMVLHRTVALKVFRHGKLPTPLAALTEARAAAALNHPNVCTVFAVDESAGTPIIVMEFLLGRPLSTLLEDGALSPERAAAVGRQIALGMASAHRLGITHGDLKPANVMLTGDGIVKITDFGLSSRRKVADDRDATQVWSAAELGKIAGTPSYMSPEQSRGAPATPASDVFSFAVLLYEMLTGRQAFTGADVLQLFHEIQNVRAERYAAEVPEPFGRILRGALMADAAERVMTMDGIVEVLADGGKS
jgi:alkyl hydroperoxide reductase subunit AhpC/tRNA A-37 threonylcarbamoyl transferase component Bud32